MEFVRGSKETEQESEWVPMAQLSALRLIRALTKTMTSKQVGERGNLRAVAVASVVGGRIVVVVVVLLVLDVV